LKIPKPKHQIRVKSQIPNFNKKFWNVLWVIFLFSLLSTLYSFAQEYSSEYVKKAWALSGEKKYDEVYQVTNECIERFSSQAEKLASTLTKFPPKGGESEFTVMNDVATCYFIQGEALMYAGKVEEAKKVFKEVIEKFPFAQSYDPRGWYWSIREKAEVTLKKLETGRIEEEEAEEKVVISKVKLYDEGSEFPVDYYKYGKFVGIGTKDYRYIVNDPIGLSKAVGEGIFPNTSSVKFDPEFIKIKKELFKIDHWQVLNSRDLKTAFYKWNVTPEPQGVRQFYIADILERSGLIKQAVKAYYAVLVHFPNSYGWTYWHTPWYIGKAALYRLKYLLKENPQLGVKLEGASIKIINGYDNSVRNDVFIINPGKLVKLSLKDRIIRITARLFGQRKRKLGKIIEERGGDKVRLIKYESGDWQLLVDGKDFIIKGITYAPTAIGQSPDNGTLQDWTTADYNNNGLIDGPYEAWVDKNRNNIKDNDEKMVGDFYLMKEMGVNCIRLYHQPFKLNKMLLREMYQKYGIYVLLGDFLGKYALGSGASWEEGTDYDNPLHRENMLKSVEEMVLEFKDEPYILMWLLGNENVYGLGCNADKKPASFFKFANEAALLIKSLDPLKRPVAIASGDTLYLDIFAENCPDIDVFGTNAYRGKYGFLDLWGEVKRVVDKPAMITEYGAPSYAKGYSLQEAEDFQALYHKASWLDIYGNSSGSGAGNAIGGFAFEWVDEWWKAYEPAYHDRKGLFAGPFLDGYMHEEWLGLCSQGDGKNSPYLRQIRKAYFTYKELWQNN
jgi:beta-glucuronidase